MTTPDTGRTDEFLRGGVLENWHAPDIRGGPQCTVQDYSGNPCT
ncbi:hypothetical protein [Roseinatronobacter sp.]